MPQLINMNFQDDPNYRYKMEVPDIKYEGQGKHDKKTVLKNAQAIAGALKCTQEDLAKYIEIRLSRPHIKDSSQNVKFGGHEDKQKIMAALKDFINKFMMCKNKQCSIPEAEYTYRPDRVVMKCRGCGGVSEILAKQDRFVNYMIRKHLATGQVKRHEAPVEHLVNRLSRLVHMENAAELVPATLREMVETRQIVEEERLPLLVASYFRGVPADDVAQWTRLLGLLKDPELAPKDLQIYYLYALELLVKQQAELFERKRDLLPAILQMSAFLDEDVVRLYQGEQAEPLVPEADHQRCLALAEMYFEWLDGQEEAEELDEQ